MLDKYNNIIYVGKAKNLKNRVRSYFVGAHNLKTTKLISEIADFSYVQTNSEKEAFLLEHNLIKEHNPKYNIRLTDDKSYPYIVITNEKHPRIITSRNVKKNLGTYFGPYQNAYAAKQTLRLLNKIYPLRKCVKLPKKECLYYHLGQCLAPCINKEKIDYEPYIKEITAFLKGNDKDIKVYLTKKMNEASDKLLFEEALEYKKLLDFINITNEQQLISFNDFKDRDFISYEVDKEDVSLQILKMRKGKIIDTKSDVFPLYLDTDNILSYLYDYYKETPIPDEICFSDKFNENEVKELFGSRAIIPKRGKKKALIDIAYKNASYDLKHERLLNKTKKEKHLEKVNAFNLFTGLENIKRIDLFDNSHTFGSEMISVMVVYKDFKPAKKEYRKYILKYTKEGDDIGAFKEVLYRRYQRALVEKTELPNLIIVDGGLNQVNAAKEIINLLNLEIKIMGLKKDLSHTLSEVIYNDKVYKINKKTPLFKLLSKMIEETHRFAITYHRKKRDKSLSVSVLDNIKGVGEVRKKKLFNKFISIDKMITGSIEEYKDIGINETLRENIIKSLKEIYEKHS
jgi:excinuclease ABC subunit C